MSTKPRQLRTFGKVKTTQTFARTLRSIVADTEKWIDDHESSDYSIGDELESDEYMTTPLAPSGVDEAVGTKSTSRKRAPRAEDPIEFRTALVKLGAMDQVGAAYLKQKRTAFYAIIRGSSNQDRVAYIRNINPMRLATPGNFVLALGDTLENLKDAPFLMDDYVDIIIRPNQIDIRNKTFFEQLFFDLSGGVEAVTEIVAEALGSLPIAESAKRELAQIATVRRRDRRKVLEIYHTNHLSTVTLEKFKQAVVDEGYDVKRFIAGDKNAEVITAAPEDLQLLLQILNEDVFRGLLTGRRLAARRKAELK